MELLLNMTIGGTMTACLILLVKRVLKDRLTPKWHLCIWIILAVRLMVPGLPESDLSVFNAVPRVERMATTVNYEMEHPSGGLADSQGEEAGLQEGIQMRNLSLEVPSVDFAGNGSFSLREQFVEGLIFAWKTGAMAVAVCFAGSAAVFRRRVGKLPLCSDAALLVLFEECKKEAGVKSGRICLRMGGNTPMLLGILRPAILIPEGYEREELRHILLHELCHYKHKDVWINMLCCFLLSVYWFNPVLWLCFFVVRRDLELVCDYRVVELTGERKAYAEVLLKAALKKNHFLFATTSLQNGEKEVTKRIRSLAHFKKPKLWISAGAVILLMVISVLCLTDGAFSPRVIHDAGEGYFFKIPQSWEDNAVWDSRNGSENDLGYTVFYDKKGNPFGGIEMLGVDMAADIDPSELQQGFPYEKIDYEAVELPLPNHSQVLSRTVIEGLLDFPVIVADLERDSETAAQEEVRSASGDLTPSKKIKETHIFLWPRPMSGRIFDLWAESGKISQGELMKIAKTFEREENPQSYRSDIDFTGDWKRTADRLLNNYFQTYADAELTRASDISGYSIQSLKRLEGGDASWNVIYPDAAVFRIDYTLDVAYPDRYAFVGGDFEIGEGNKTKIFKDELAVFSLNREGRAVFFGFISASYADALGEDTAIISLINHGEMKERAAALIEAKTPYIGDNSKVGKLIGLMPMAEHFAGMELQTEEEPYRITVNYDLTEIGNLLFENSEEPPHTENRSWDFNPCIKSQMFQNAAMLLSLIDNAGEVDVEVKGVSEEGVRYYSTRILSREKLNEKFVRAARLSAGSIESYCGFLDALEQSQIFPEQKDTVYRIN